MIEPGVEILINQFTGIIVDRGTLIANGTLEDSIFFLPLVDLPWRNITLAGAHSEFSYCHFIFSQHPYEDEGTISCSGGSLQLEYSTFYNCQNGIFISNGDVGIRWCLFQELGFFGIHDWSDGDLHHVVENCTFVDFDRHRGYEATSTLGAIIDKSIFMNTFCVLSDSGTITNSTFINSYIESIGRVINNCVVENSCFFWL